MYNKYNKNNGKISTNTLIETNVIHNKLTPITNFNIVKDFRSHDLINRYKSETPTQN